MSKKLSGCFALLALLGLTLFLMSCGSSSSRPAGVLYVVSQGENNVGSYAIDLNTGRLSLINTNAKADVTPSSILLDPSGKVAYVLNTGSNTITTYTINDNGALSTPTITALPIQNSVAMARDAAGTFLIVVSQGTIPAQACQQAHSNQGCGEPPAITVFTTSTGSASLTQVGGPVLLNFIPTSVTASITGTFNDPNSIPPGGTVAGTLVHVTGNQDLVGTNDNTISEYVVQGSGVVAGPLIGSPYATASNPSSVLAITTTPTGGTGGLFVYVTNVTTNNLSIYQVCTVPDGTNCLSSSDDVHNAKMIPVGSPISLGLDPVAMAVDPTNNFLYVVNHTSSTISSFRINPTNGVLSVLNLNVSAGQGPVGIAMHSSGKYLYVSNNTASNISGFNVNTTSGALSNATNVTSSAQPAGLVAK